MEPIAPELLELAESLNTHLPLGPGDKRVVTPHYVVWMGPGEDPHFNVVQRLRIPPSELVEVVAEVRLLLASRGRRAATWEVGPSANPPDLVARLVSLGMVPDPEEPVATGMVLRRAPTGPPVGIEVRRVSTLPELETVMMIFGEGFGLVPDGDLEAELRDLVEGGAQARYLAFLEGRPVAAGAAAFTARAGVLSGSATLPAFRGRGAYRALVAARLADSAARGTPALVVQAGKMSRPILERLGFEPVVAVQILVDLQRAG